MKNKHVESYQWTNALLAYIRSNLWSRLDQASAMEVVLESMQMALVKEEEVVEVVVMVVVVEEVAIPPGHLSQVAPRHDRRRLVVDADLEAGGAPVDELDAALRLDGGDGGVHVLGHHVSPGEVMEEPFWSSLR